MHYRQRIRDAVAAALNGETAAGANVFTSRARPVLEVLQRKESVLSVYTSDEQSVRDGTGHLLARTLSVSVEGMMGGADDLDDLLDDLAAEVEAVIDADPTLGNLLSEDLVLESTSSEISARGNMQVGAFRMDFSCAYQTQRMAPGYLPADEYGVEIPEPPVPTLVTTDAQPVPDAYVNASMIPYGGEPSSDCAPDPSAVGLAADFVGDSFASTGELGRPRPLQTDIAAFVAEPVTGRDADCACDDSEVLNDGA